MHTTDSRHTMPVSPNVLARRFDQPLPNQAWASDITYIRTRSGWLYRTAVLDLHSRKIVGWAMAPEMPATLVRAALQMAIAQRNPRAGLIVHSDRGTQGEFNRSSQHWVVERILGIRSGSQPASFSRAFCEVYCSAHELRLESPGRSTETGRCPSGSIGAGVRSCSRSCRAATDCEELRRRPSPLTHS